MTTLSTNRVSVRSSPNSLKMNLSFRPHAVLPTLLMISTDSSGSRADAQHAGTARRDPRRSRLTLKLEPARLSPEPADGVARVPTICRWRVSRGLEANEGLDMERCALHNHINRRVLSTTATASFIYRQRSAVRVLRKWQSSRLLGFEPELSPWCVD
ncbi:hypothetical protein BDW68DRAFT_84031 [Aspergillus falconensis]